MKSETGRMPLRAFVRPPCGALPSPASPNSAYIHLPFCAQQCAYCAFPIVVSGRSALPLAESQRHPPPQKTHRDYVDWLCSEIRAVGARWQSDTSFPQPTPLSTLYLGGGTPSLLHPSLLERVIHTVSDAIGLRTDAEITCEMDPATFTAHTAEAYRKIGVNRASVGAQSFDDELLAACRRVHRSEDINSAVAALRDAGFENISLDLISGLPGQTLSSWKASLEAALDLHPEHVSSYDLTLEPGTTFGIKYESGVRPLPSEDLTVDMMMAAADLLGSAAFEHYEISNFARKTQCSDLRLDPTSLQHQPRMTKKSPFRSRHNMAYWRNDPFYAFGLGATSVLDGYRFARPRRMPDYRAYVDGLHTIIPATDNMINEVHRRKNILQQFYPGVKLQTKTERLEDYLINSFRLLVEGVNLEEVEALFGPISRERLITAVERNGNLVENGSLKVQRNEQHKISSIGLTEQGALIENSVLSTIMQEAVWKHCGG